MGYSRSFATITASPDSSTMRHALIVPLLAFAAATASLAAQDPTKQDPPKPVAADTAAPAKSRTMVTKPAKPAARKPKAAAKAKKTASGRARKR